MYTIIPNTYDKEITFDSQKLQVYSEKKLEDLYPEGDYLVVGFIDKSNKNKAYEKIIINDKVYGVYRSNTKRSVLSHTVGYIQIDEKTFLSVKKKNLLLILLFLTGLLILLFCLSHFKGSNLVDNEDVPTATPEQIENDTSEKADGNSVSIWYNLKAKSTTDSDVISLTFGNPNKSTHALKVMLYDANDVLIGQSELLEPGYKLEGINKLLNLPAGEYNCYFLVKFYGQDLSEVPNIDTKIPDVKLTIN